MYKTSPTSSDDELLPPPPTDFLDEPGEPLASVTPKTQSSFRVPRLNLLGTATRRFANKHKGALLLVFGVCVLAALCAALATTASTTAAHTSIIADLKAEVAALKQAQANAATSEAGAVQQAVRELNGTLAVLIGNRVNATESTLTENLAAVSARLEAALEQIDATLGSPTCYCNAFSGNVQVNGTLNGVELAMDAGSNDALVDGVNVAALSREAVRRSGKQEIAGDLSVQGSVSVLGAFHNENLSEQLYSLKRNLTISPGTIHTFAGSTVPTGWLKCDGLNVSTVKYSALYAVIGDTYGNGATANQTDFVLPDLRGEFLRGWDEGRGIDPDRELGSLQMDGFKSHTHRYTQRSICGDGGGMNYNGAHPGGYSSCSSPQQPTTSIGGDETRPRNIAFVFGIKY